MSHSLFLDFWLSCSYTVSGINIQEGQQGKGHTICYRENAVSSVFTFSRVIWLGCTLKISFHLANRVSLLSTKLCSSTAFRADWPKEQIFSKYAENTSLGGEDKDKKPPRRCHWDLLRRMDNLDESRTMLCFSTVVFSGDIAFKGWWRYHINIYCWGYTGQD